MESTAGMGVRGIERVKRRAWLGPNSDEVESLAMIDRRLAPTAHSAAAPHDLRHYRNAAQPSVIANVANITVSRW